MDILDSINNFIEMGSTGALMIEGAWGCGKTYCLENSVFPALNERDRVCVRVSLFGVKDVGELPAKVLQAYLEKTVSIKTKKDIKLGNIVNIVTKATELFPKFKDYVDVTKVLAQGNLLYTVVPSDTIICFDDLERAAETLNLNNLLGAVNELVENRHYKVILVANKEYIDKKYAPSDGIEKTEHDSATGLNNERELFYEKVVEKTIVFEPAIKAIYEQLVKEYKDNAFTVFMLKDSIISKVDLDAIKSRRLKKQFQNLRTLKFSIEHFNKVWQQLDKSDIEDENSLSFRKMRNIWTFIHSVSIEMKKNELKYDDERGLNKFYDIILDDKKDREDDLFSDEYDTDKKADSNDFEYIKWFKKVYYENYNEPFLFYQSIYGFITASRNLNIDEIETQVKRAFVIKDDEVSEGQNVLGTLLTYGFWSFTNEQSYDNLKKLLKSVSKGQLRDYASYYNAGVYLFGFKEIIGTTEDELKDVFTKGIKIFTKNLQEVSYLTTTNVRMLPQDSPESKWICSLIMSCVDKRLASEHKKDSETLEEEFMTDIEKLTSRFVPTSMSTPEYISDPILATLHKSKVHKRMKDLQPKEVMALYSMVKGRYLDMECSRIAKEEVFLAAMQQGLNAIRLDEPLMSNWAIKKYLLPVLSKAINICQQINTKNRNC